MIGMVRIVLIMVIRTVSMLIRFVRKANRLVKNVVRIVSMVIRRVSRNFWMAVSTRITELIWMLILEKV